MEKTITFYEKEKAIDYETGSKVGKSTIITEIRKQKIQGNISSYIYQNNVSGNVFYIKLTNGDAYNILTAKGDIYASSLHSLLKAKDIVRMTEKQEYMTVRGMEEKVGEKSKKEILTILDQLHKNDEILSVIKKEKKKNDVYENYIIELEEEELVLKTYPNGEVSNYIDETMNVYKIKNQSNHLKKLIAAGALSFLVLTASTPYVRGEVKEVKQKITNYIYEQEVDANMRSNWPLLNSYALRLKGDNLSKSDYYEFLDLLSYMERYYQTKNKIDSEDYKKLLEYSNLANEKYDSIVRKSY